MVEWVADQVCVELRARTTNKYDDYQPLHWSLHGGPGTGKSHVITIIKTELFEKLLQQQIAEDFHIVALQAVMADLLGGDTIHHILNLPVVGQTKLWPRAQPFYENNKRSRNNCYKAVG